MRLARVPRSRTSERTRVAARLTTWYRRMLDTSAPLLAGIAGALVLANVDSGSYRQIVFGHLPVSFRGHPLSLHFLVNDCFMVLFFGLAAKEIVDSLRPGGSLHPPRRAANPVLASLGGVAGPALVYLGLIHGFFREAPEHEILMSGWAVPTATDIALVWITARAVFGRDHPAVDYLLLLAIVDDFVGLAILALAFPREPASGTAFSSALLVIAGLAIAWSLHRARVGSWIPYVSVAGVAVWSGLLGTTIHPALALVPVVPFMFAGRRDSDSLDAAARFEGFARPVVGTGLFFFGFANAGVELGDVMFVTWVVLAALVLGKTAGIASFSWIATHLGYPLPKGMRWPHLLTAGCLASIGLTLSLFLAGQAFPAGSAYQDAARLGALASALVGVVAVVVSRALQVGSECKAVGETLGKEPEPTEREAPG